jgi:hypothetical protein
MSLGSHGPRASSSLAKKIFIYNYSRLEAIFLLSLTHILKSFTCVE